MSSKFIYKNINVIGSVWRPSRINLSNLSKFKELNSLWHTIEECCFACGFSPASFYRFLDKNPQFREEIRDTKWVYSRFLAKQNVNQALIDGDIQVSLTFLKHTDSDWKKPEYKTNNFFHQSNTVHIGPKRAKEIIASIEKKAKILESWEFAQISKSR